MKKLQTSLITIALIFVFANQYAFGQTMYKVTLFRAAPGKLLPLIENLTKRVSTYQENGGNKPYIIRHSQGDQWDLMIYEHIGGYNTYYSTTSGLDHTFTPPHGFSHFFS